MSDNSSNHKSGTLTAFMAGALLGAGLVLLYAPRSGKETRNLLIRKVRPTREKLGGIWQSTKENVEKALADAKYTIAKKKAEGFTPLSDGKFDRVVDE